VEDLNLQFVDLGRIGYAAALEIQREVHAEILEGRRGPTVFLLEHDPVITVSKRDTAMGNVLASAELLRSEGVELCETDRGGDVTYHGPGQLVVYPIVPLAMLGMNVRQFVCMLEQAIIDTVKSFGVTAGRDSAGIGVWVAGAKVAAIGVRVRRWVPMHGLALNVTTNLDHFKLIVPCGLTRPVTSLQLLLGDRCPGMPAVKSAMIDALRRLAAQPPVLADACRPAV
jgi:lipoyl(octanoyl) transferase